MHFSDALIPFLVSSRSIDYRDNLVNFTYNPSRIARCVPGVRIADCY
jgi:hypothetical protein